MCNYTGYGNDVSYFLKRSVVMVVGFYKIVVYLSMKIPFYRIFSKGKLIIEKEMIVKIPIHRQRKEDHGMTSMNDLPEILTAKHIATYLGISRRRVYELFQLRPNYGGIPNFDIGASKRVEKKDFVVWIEARKGEKSQSLVG